MKKILAKLFIIAGFLGLLLTAGKLLSRISPFEVQKLLSPEHPVRIKYQEYLKMFDDEKTAYLMIKSKNGPLNDEYLEDLSNDLTDFLQNERGIINVLSPTNAKYFNYSDSAFALSSFIENHKITPQSRDILKTEMWKSYLISDNFTSFLVHFSFSNEIDRKQEKPLIDKIKNKLTHITSQNENLEAHLLGTKIASASFLDEMSLQMRVITPLLLLVIGLFLYFLYRSWQILIWNFFVMIVCYVTTLVLIILIEDGLGPYSSFALMFSFIVATTDLIHYFCRFQQIEGSIEERMKKTREIAYVPCLLTSLTTAAGFVALIINQNLPIRYFGLYCAFACMLEFFVIFYLLPPILRVFNFSAPVRKAKFEGTLIAYWDLLSNNSKFISISSIVVILCMGAFTFFLKIDDNFYTKFKDQHSLSKAIAAFSQDFQFVGSIDVLFTPQKGSISDKENLQLFSKIESEIKAHPLVSRISSERVLQDEISNTLANSKSKNLLHMDIKKSLIEMIRNYGLLSDYENEKENIFRSIVFLKSLSTEDFNKVQEHIQKINNHYKDSMKIEASGFSVVRSFINSHVISDFLQSFILSFVLIFLCFLFLYKNPKWAFLALLPNALPLLMISGLMGILQISVDSNLVMLFCITFGISGDNTIHMSYLLQRSSHLNLNYKDSLLLAMRQVGYAMVATSAIFIVCLPCFLIGQLKLFNQIAIFLSLSFLMAFYSDLFMFPSLQILFKDKARLGAIPKR